MKKLLNELDEKKNTDNSIDLHQAAVTKFIEVNGTRYAYRAFGNNSDIPLILLQHFTGTMDNWDPQVTNGLAKHFQVVLFDNKGIGASGGETASSIEEMAHDTISLIKALGFEKVDLLGFSMGGFIAQQITLLEPALINKLILAGTGPKGGEGITNIVTPLTASVSMTPDEQKLYLFYEATPTSRALGKLALSRINKRTENRSPDAELPSIQAQLKSILEWAAPDVNALDQLKKIKQSVLVINGSHDIMVPTINSYVLFQNLPKARLSLYPDAGHGAIFQYPELFLDEVIPFLERN